MDTGDLTSEDMDKSLRSITESVISDYTGKDSVEPTVYVRGLDLDSQQMGTAIVMIGNFPDSRSVRRSVFREIGGALAKQNIRVKVAFFVAEAWMVKKSAMNSDEIDIDSGSPLVQPSMHPKRREVIVIVGRSYEGNYNASTIEIKRDGDGNIVAGNVEYVDVQDGDTFKDDYLPEMFNSNSEALGDKPLQDDDDTMPYLRRLLRRGK